MKIKRVLSAVRDCDSGATAIEYGLIVSLLAISLIVALNSFAGETIQMWNHVESSVESAR